jgi:hypothetical protein
VIVPEGANPRAESTVTEVAVGGSGNTGAVPPVTTFTWAVWAIGMLLSIPLWPLGSVVIVVPAGIIDPVTLYVVVAASGGVIPDTAVDPVAYRHTTVDP